MHPVTHRELKRSAIARGPTYKHGMKNTCPKEVTASMDKARVALLSPFNRHRNVFLIKITQKSLSEPDLNPSHLLPKSSLLTTG